MLIFSTEMQEPIITIDFTSLLSVKNTTSTKFLLRINKPGINLAQSARRWRERVKQTMLVAPVCLNLQNWEKANDWEGRREMHVSYKIIFGTV